MKLKDLEYFNHLINTKSYSETAKHFYISQPSISMAIKRLEEDFDAKLINRGHINKRLELTDIGKVVYKRTENIFEILDLINTEVDNYKNNRVVLGIPPIIGAYLLPKILPHTKKFNGDLKLIEAPGSLSLYELILEDKISTAIVGSLTNKKYPEKLIQVPMMLDEFYVAVSKNSKLSELKQIDPHILVNENFISLGEGFAQSKALKNWFNQNDLNHPKIHFTNEIQTAKALVSANVGVSLLIGMLVDSNDNIEKVKIKNSQKFYINLLINKNMIVSKNQKLFNKRLISISEDNLFENL